jgi:DNA-binding transcriptional LysR family regulator
MNSDSNFTHNRVQLTHAGKLSVEDARQLVTRAKEAALRAKNAAEGKSAALTVGYLTSTMNEMFSKILFEFQERCPEVELVLNDLIPLPIIDGVRERRLDIGFMRFLVWGRGRARSMCLRYVLRLYFRVPNRRSARQAGGPPTRLHLL